MTDNPAIFKDLDQTVEVDPETLESEQGALGPLSRFEAGDRGHFTDEHGRMIHFRVERVDGGET